MLDQCNREEILATIKIGAHLPTSVKQLAASETQFTVAKEKIMDALALELANIIALDFKRWTEVLEVALDCHAKHMATADTD